MSDPVNDNIRHIELIYQHRALIDEAIRSRGIVLSDENRVAIRQLQQARILTIHREGIFRVSRSLQEHFDEVAHKRRGYEVGRNIGAEVARLGTLVREYEMAAVEGIASDQERHLDDIDDALFRISQDVARDLTVFRTVTENEFSDVASVEEKARQNEHYIAQARALDEVLVRLNSDDLLAALSSPYVASIQAEYVQTIRVHLPEWRAMLIDIIDILERFMWRFRRVARDLKRFRALSRFLRDRPEFEIEGTGTETPEWSWRLIGQGPLPLPDITNMEVSESLADMFRDGTLKAPVTTIRRSVGKRRKEPRQVIIIPEEPVPLDIALRAYVSDCAASTDPVSALSWIANNPQTTPFGVNDWMDHVLNWANAARKVCNVNLIAREGRRGRCGNVAVMDITAWKKT